MKMTRKVILPLLFVGLSIAGASLFSSSVYAQTDNCSSVADQAACQQRIATIQAALGGNVTAVAGLDACDSGKWPPNGWTGQTCGMVAQKAGTTPYNHNPYNAGDTVKCAYGYHVSGSEQCAITPKGGTTIYTDSGSLTQQTYTQQDNGQVQGTYTNSASAAVSSGLQDIGSLILKAVATFVLAFANWLLGVAGVLFNLIMIYGVFQFGNTIGNSPGVLTAWGILRDLANMALLFGFIFMGIATILDTGAVQNFTAKKALPSLLIFAVLMNFSLFTCEAIIDISNALSSTMYSQANTSPCEGGITTALTDTSCGISYGLAGHIMQSTGLAGIWAVKDNTPLGSQAFAFLGLALFATIGAIVFFAAAIMLAIRVIMLTLLMVVSPIGFAGMAIPPLRNLAGNWWSRVIHQAFYAPIMLLLILISLKIADSFTVNGGDNGLGAAVLSPDTSVMGVFVVFMLVIGFLVASLIAANKFGAAGASFAVKSAGRMTYGTVGFVGRRTAGRGSAAFGRYVRNSKMGDTEMGRRLSTFADKGAKASFDLRGTKLSQGAAKAVGLDLGAAQKGGIAKNIADQKKARVDYAKTLTGRLEKEEEFETRIEGLSKTTAEAAELVTTAAAATDAQFEAMNTASSELQDIQAERKTLDQKLEHMRTLSDRNPADADMKKKVREQEQAVAEAAKKETVAEQRLALETQKLATAREHERNSRDSEEKARKVEQDAVEKGPVRITGMQQQESYAQNLENAPSTGEKNEDTPWRRQGQLRPLFGLSGRANEEAASAIRKEMKKSESQKAIEALKESLEKGNKAGEEQLGSVKEAIEKEAKEKNDDHGGDHGDH